MLSIHNNFSAGAQNVTGAQLFVQGYNLEVHDVLKHTQKHSATVKL